MAILQQLSHLTLMYKVQLNSMGEEVIMASRGGNIFLPTTTSTCIRTYMHTAMMAYIYAHQSNPDCPCVLKTCPPSQYSNTIMRSLDPGESMTSCSFTTLGWSSFLSTTIS